MNLVLLLSQDGSIQPEPPHEPQLPPSPSLQVLETCVKNCGHRFHVQVANRDFMDGVLVKIIAPKNNPPTIVQDKVLSLIQVSEQRPLPFYWWWQRQW